MDWIKVYIQEVTRRLPEKSRDDIALELQSTIEDMLPEPHTEDDVKSVLEKLGDPAVLAEGYRDQPAYLIGPRYYEVYVNLLKIVVPIAIVFSLIMVIIGSMFGHAEGAPTELVGLEIVGEVMGTMISVSAQAFFWITIIFTVIDRVDRNGDFRRSNKTQKWTADQLKKAPQIVVKRAISQFEVFQAIFWTAVWVTIYFNAYRIVGIYEGGWGKLRFVTPAVNQDVLNAYMPAIIIMLLLTCVLILFKILLKQWTKPLAILNTVHELFAALWIVMILSHPSIYDPGFIRYLVEKFGTASEMYLDRALWLVIVIFVISAIWNSIDGFRKASRTP